MAASDTAPPALETEPQGATRLVTEPAALDGLLAELATAPAVALDTEFHAERRYRPQLLLVQVGVPGRGTWMVDPIAVSVERLAATLVDKELIVHAGQADLPLLLGEGAEAPRKIFDTQIAAAMLGEPYPARLSQVASRFLGRTMDKEAALSDWTTRPLGARQLAYAAADVDVLLELHPVLCAALDARGRRDWVAEASAEMARAALHPPPPGERWRTWRIAGELEEAERSCLSALFEWRDQKARERDQPPHYLLPDGMALDLARRRPSTLEELARDRRVSPALVRKHGAALISVISGATSATSPPSPAPDATVRMRVATLELWAQLYGQQIDVAADVLLPPDLALRIARASPSALTGWRRAVIQSPLDDFFSGSQVIEFTMGTPRICPAT